LRIAVFEYLCSSGAYSDDGPSGPYGPLLDEGSAMLLSLASDLASCNHRVSIALEPSIQKAWNHHLAKASALANLDVHRIASSNDLHIERIANRWASVAQSCDCSIVIAPELDGLLVGIIQAMRKQGCLVIAPDDLFLQTASDKWATYQSWIEHEQPAIPTLLASESPCDLRRLINHAYKSDGWVLKRRRTAGGTDMQRFESFDALADHLACLQQPQDWIVQPWVCGTPVSLAVAGSASAADPPICLLGPTEQLFDPSSGCYVGGQGPLEVDAERLGWFARGLLEALGGRYAGWVGIDFLILPEGAWVPLEINARLTSSYLGYRQIMGPQLANRILGIPAPYSSCHDRSNPGVFRFSVSDFHG
jgi:predicted ATP-grasp superfamily ATP-dependent carboligase